MESLKNFRVHGIIFDKDGTLIDFDAMWGGWVVYLANELQKVSNLNIKEPLYTAFGYDAENSKVLPTGKLASRPMAQLRDLTIEMIQSLGLDGKKAELIVEKAWCIPDPVILAKPLTDLHYLFSELDKQNIKIGIATADDRASTQAMIEAFDLEEFISAMACGDDGLLSKPSPDMVLKICERMKIDPAHVIVFGDTISDLKMARAAGAGLTIGVLSGVSSARDLAAYADVIIESIDELHAVINELTGNPSTRTHTGLDPDFVF